MIQLENERIKAIIALKGAELQSLVRKDVDQEYMWSGDPAFWGKKSPVLFPIVGGLKQNQYSYKGQTYQLGRHGFARDQEFTVTEQSQSTARLTLTDNEATRRVYPFAFRFSLVYALQPAGLSVSYIVENTGNDTLWFSVGGHPAFKLPLSSHCSFEDYYLDFSETENAGRWPLSPEGLISHPPQPLLNNTGKLPLSKPLFYEDALVLKQLQSTSVSLQTDKDPQGLRFHFEGFPFLGIWSAKNADFICIEPWCGIADSVDASGRLEEKEGIESLAPGQQFTRTWSVDLF
jgi:galactose mutarotase-like enzyme